MELKKQEKKDIYTIAVQLNTKDAKPLANNFFQIDKKMLPFKLHFFLFIGAVGVTFPYMTIFATRRIGLSNASLGGMLMIQQFLFIVTKPLLGYIADYFHKLKAIIGILIILQTILFFSLLLIPRIPEQTSKEDLYKTPLGNLEVCDLYDVCETSNTKKVPINIKDSLVKIYLIKTDTKSSGLCSFKQDIPLNFTKQQLISTSLTVKNIKINQTVEETDIKAENMPRDISADIPQYLSFETCMQDSNRSCVFLNSNCALCCHIYSGCYTITCASENSTIRDDSHISDKSEFQTYQFWSFVVIITIAYIFTNSLFTLSDTACCETVMKTGAEFGRQRLYGAIGWGLGAPIGGYLNDLTEDYLASWVLMGLLSLLSLWNLHRMDLAKPQFSQNILKDVGTVLASKEYLAFALLVLMNGFGAGVMWFYYALFLTEIGGSRFLCGLAQSVQCFGGELPFMFFAGWIIKKLGHFNVMTLSLSAFCIRFLWYSNLTNPWYVLPFECLNGLTYGVFCAAVASYAKKSAKPGTEATTQSILFTTHEGLGAGVGCILFGVGMERFSGYKTFFIASISAGFCAVLSVFMHVLIHKRKTLVVTSRK